MNLNEFFRKIALKTSHVMGSSKAFALAFLVVVTWALVGPYYNYSDTWQLVINTSTTILTFLMIFLVQNTQNRDAKAMHLKLDELIRAHKASRNQLIDLEDLSDAEMERIHDQFHLLHEKAAKKKDHDASL
jgi:low affinity Fe/Cu permease